MTQVNNQNRPNQPVAAKEFMERFEDLTERVTKSIEARTGKGGIDKLSKEEHEHITETLTGLCEEVNVHYHEDRLIGRISKDIGRKVADETLFAYDNRWWWADKLAGGVVTAVGAGAALFAIKTVSDFVRGKPADLIEVHAEGDNPFNTDGSNATAFRASPRPTKAGKQAPPADMQNLMN